MKRRPRRLRGSASMRRMVSETRLAPSDFILPLFVRPGRGVRTPVASMPGVFQMSVDRLVQDVKESTGLGLAGVLLFGVPERKDPEGSGAYDERGIVPEAIRAVKEAAPETNVITDVCLCGYTDHGHCGVLEGRGASARIDNDATVELLARTAAAHAAAGVDMVAPSAMMDGQVGAIRSALDESGAGSVGILAYSAKYASGMYGPFRDAAECPPKFGDRRTYQMDPGNAREALREVALDIEEGADIVMVKPALAYLDVIRMVKDRFAHPVAAYNVSGEYSMVKAAAERGWLDERTAAIETLTAIKRAGADLILTYWAKDAARWLAEG